MPAKQWTSAFTAGLLSGGLFLLVFGIGLGFIFMFLPALPLLMHGMRYQPNVARAGAGIAALLVTLLAGGPAGLLYLLLMGLPSISITERALRFRIGKDGLEWYPIGWIFLRLTLYGCLLVALGSAFYNYTNAGLIPVMEQNVRDAFREAPPEFTEAVDLLATNASFLVFGMTIWLWCIGLYLHGLLAVRLLRGKIPPSLRPDFSLTPFAMPDWMMGLLLIAALAILIGSPEMAYLGKASFVALLLPYFLLGAALLQTVSIGWSNRLFYLSFIYIMAFILVWPTLVICLLGLWHHFKSFNKRLSSGGTSSSS